MSWDLPTIRRNFYFYGWPGGGQLCKMKLKLTPSSLTGMGLSFAKWLVGALAGKKSINSGHYVVLPWNGPIILILAWILISQPRSNSSIFEPKINIKVDFIENYVSVDIFDWGLCFCGYFLLTIMFLWIFLYTQI